MLALASMLIAGTACSGKSSGPTASCGSPKSEFAVANEVALDKAISRSLAIDSELRKVFVPYENRDESSGVLIVDADKHEIEKDISLDGGAGTVAIDKKSHLLYVRTDAHTAAVLDAKTGERLRSLPIPAPRFAIDSSTGLLYAGGDNGAAIYAVNTETGESAAMIELEFRASRIVIDEENHRVYAASTGSEKGGSVAVIDTTDNHVIATVEVKGSDGGLAVDSANKRVFASSSYYGVVSVIDGTTGALVATYDDFYTPYSMARCGDVLFVANRDPGDLVVVNAMTGDIAQTFPVGYHPEAMSIDDKTGNLWVLSTGDTAETTPGLLSIIAPRG